MKRLLPVAILLLNVIPLCAQQRLDAYGDPLPDGALARMGSQRFRPPQNRFGAGDICVAVMPDGKTFATGEERGVRFWDMKTGEEIGFVPLAIQRVEWLQFDSNGKRFVVLADRHPPGGFFGEDSHTIHVGDTETKKIIWDTCESKPSRRGFSSPTFAADDSVVIVREIEQFGMGTNRNDPGKILLFNATQGTSVELGMKVCSFSVSPNGRKVVGGTENGDVLVFDIAERRKLGEWKALERQILAMCWSPDGKFVALASEATIVNGKSQDDWRIQVWDVATKKQKFEAKTVPGSTWRLGFSPDCRLLVSHGCIWNKETSQQEQTRIWELEKGEELWRDKDKPSRMPKSATMPNGMRLNFELRNGIGDADLLVVRAETPAKKELWKWLARGGDKLWNNVATNNDQVLINSRNRELRIIDWQTSADRADHGGHRTRIQDLRYTGDGSYLLSIDENQFARLWQPNGSRVVYPEDCKTPWAGVRILSTGALLFVDQEGAARVWDPTAKADARSLAFEPIGRFLEEDADRNSSFDLTPTGKLAIHTNQGIELWDVLSGKRLSTQKEPIDIEKRLTFSQDGQ